MDALQAWGLNLGPHVGPTGALLLVMSFYFLSFETGFPSVYSATGLELVSHGLQSSWDFRTKSPGLASA